MYTHTRVHTYTHVCTRTHTKSLRREGRVCEGTEGTECVILGLRYQTVVGRKRRRDSEGTEIGVWW